MALILSVLEPFALGLWRHEIADWLPSRVSELKKELAFGGLYQRLVITV